MTTPLRAATLACALLLLAGCDSYKVTEQQMAACKEACVALGGLKYVDTGPYLTCYCDNKASVNFPSGQP